MSTRTAKQVRAAHAAADALRAKHSSNLDSMLRGIPRVNAAAIPLAVRSLIDAADMYKASRPIVDEDGRRSQASIADGRASIKTLAKHLISAQSTLSTLPLNAFTELAHAYDAPIGKLKANLEAMCDAVVATQFNMAQQPDKTHDHARNILACDVAIVFRDILKLKPSSVSDKSLNITNRRGGAAYARVLRQTLAAAGFPLVDGVAQVDIGPLITAGIKRLNDPDLPHNL